MAMLPSDHQADWDELLRSVPSWARPRDPKRFFELLGKESLTDDEVEQFIDAAGAAPQEVCDQQWERLQERIAADDETALALQALESISAFPTIAAVLGCLLTFARRHFINTIRYYRYVPEEEKLVSIESAGHAAEPEVAMRLKLGHIVKFRYSSPLETKDSFWSLDRRTPVVFVLDDFCTPPFDPRPAPRGMTLVRVPWDQCEHVLARHKPSMWVDFPLIAAGEIIGKLSCDLATDRLTEEVAALLLRFWRIVQVASLYIGAVTLQADRRGSIVVHDSWGDIQRVQTVQELFEYCTRQLPAKVDCRHASILTVSKDSIGTEKLVLRRTSYERSKVEENIGHYDLKPILRKSLTTWVAESGRALRLQNLDNKEFFEKQSDAYGGGLVWANKIQDSTNHKSFLAVPLLAPQQGVVGVLRLTEKHNGEEGAFFTETDERILTAVARDAIGPKLVSLIDKEVSDWLSREVVSELLKNACDLRTSLASRRAIQVLQDAFCRAMETIFPEKGRFARLYLLNWLDKEGRHFRHVAIGGRLRCELREHNRVYELDRTLTGRALYQQDDVVFLNDLPRAEEQGVMMNVVPRAKCALAHRLSAGGRRGSIVVESEGYDIDPETDGRLLRVLARNTEKLLETSNPSWC